MSFGKISLRIISLTFFLNHDWFCPRFLNYLASGFLLEEASSYFPTAQTQDTHTETILFKTLLGPLSLASYWLTLTY